MGGIKPPPSITKKRGTDEPQNGETVKGKVKNMKTYQVEFTGFSAFTDTALVYDVSNRQEAIKAVKAHYGKNVKIISAKVYKD